MAAARTTEETGMKLTALTCGAIIIATPATAGSSDYCESYATKSIDAVMRFMWNRLYSTCMAMPDNPAPIQEWGEFSGRIDEPNQLPDTTPVVPLAQIGVVPATGKPASASVKPVASVAASGSNNAPAAICGRVHKHVQWSGKHWNCRP